MQSGRRGGGFQPPRLRTRASQLAVAVGGVSLLCAAMPELFSWVALAPKRVFFQFTFWQPITYLFVAGDMLGLLFGVMTLWSVGGMLEHMWGPRRVLTFAASIGAVSGVLTLLVSLVLPSLRDATIPGAWTVAIAFWVAMGLSIGRGQASFWGVPTTGNVLALVGVGFVILSLIQQAPEGVPNLISAALTFGYMRGYWRPRSVLSPRRLWLRFQSWNLQRQRRNRSKGLRVLGGKDVNPSSRDSDRFLH